MADYKEIELSKLLVDTLNPRLEKVEKTQSATLAEIVRMQGSKLVELAEDIAAFGLSPLDGFLVMPVKGTDGDYVVLEGNRRTTALKLLANPALSDGGLTKAQAAKLTALAKQAGISNTTKVMCVVVKGRDDADHWLQLRHGGEQDGVGLVKWGAKEKARVQERRKGKPDPYLALLSHLVVEGAISEDEAGAVKYSNLERVLSDAHVREKLGVDLDKKAGVISTYFPKAETLKGLGAFAKKLSVSTVYDIDKADDRKKFVGALKADLPDPKKKLAVAQPLGGTVGAGTNGAGGSNGQGTGKGAKKVKESKTVAPATPALAIKHKRINKIYGELRKLRLEDHTNSGAVMLRVFLELTVDEYIKVHKVPKPKEETLRKKLRAVADHLEKNGVMTTHELKPIRNVTDGSNFLATSVESMNAYVHNKDFHPLPGDVRAVWDNLEPLFVHIWK